MGARNGNGLHGADLRVRMYRVGFGDCFLVSFPAEGGHRHVLVDCGVHPKGDIKTFDRVVQELRAATAGRLALVVATHEHADHISGFGKYEKEFSRFHIGEVWMPWAMDAEDAHATRLRRKRAALADRLQAHLGAAASPEAAAALANLRGNAPAVAALRSGFSGAAREVRYFAGGDAARTLAEVPGLRVRVLGPPRDEAFLRKMDPPASQRFLRGAGGPPEDAVDPFPRKWWLTRNEGRKAFGSSPSLERELLGLDDSAEALALALSEVVNNTSLVLLFEFRGQALLFAGDAQWGNWKAWLEGDHASTLLEQVSFLKVAHHGSHNATPHRAVEGLRVNGFAAMVSTQNEPWESIPQRKLIDGLLQQSGRRVARSDSIAVGGAPRGPDRAEDLGPPFRHRTGEPWIDWVRRV